MVGHSTGHDSARMPSTRRTSSVRLQHHFYSMGQQLEASILGMWIFLVTEVMFFGGLFLAYIVYRTTYPLAWEKSSQELNVVSIGALNTGVLICSSLTMVLAVRSAQVGSRKGQIVNLILTILLGTTFLVDQVLRLLRQKFVHGLVPGPHFGPHHVMLASRADRAGSGCRTVRSCSSRSISC